MTPAQVKSKLAKCWVEEDGVHRLDVGGVTLGTITAARLSTEWVGISIMENRTGFETLEAAKADMEDQYEWLAPVLTELLGEAVGTVYLDNQKRPKFSEWRMNAFVRVEFQVYAIGGDDE
jgi:hypothetical protein